ncbi:hypothetical protein P3T23_001199 [Paraburkholderia sp. GAS448]|uniref:DUF2844 domain-containing protein n=1 Tax=Paraburkholderia sp. GAS448 TaxID=3035136 RepID=UPI003D1B6FA3
MSSSSRLTRAVTSTVLALCGSVPAIQSAHAELGGSPMTTPASASLSLRSAQAVSSAVTRSASSAAPAASSTSSAAPATPASFTIRETTLGNGTVVREYVTSTGTVFGIAWQGPQMPDLSALLGGYFQQYVDGVKAARAAYGRRGAVAVDQDTLVVRSGGHMGAFAGQAWLPRALPAGVSGQDIQ